MNTHEQNEQDERDQAREYEFYWAGGCPRCREPGILRYTLVPRRDGAVDAYLPVHSVEFGTCSACRMFWWWGENNTDWKWDYLRDPEGARARADAFKAELGGWTYVTSDAAQAVWDAWRRGWLAGTGAP